MFACSAVFPPSWLGGTQQLSSCNAGRMYTARRRSERRAQVCCTVENSCVLGIAVAQPLARAAPRAITIAVAFLACSAAFPSPGADGKRRFPLCSIGWLRPACRGAKE